MGFRVTTLARPLIGAALSPHPLDRYLELLDPMLVRGESRARVIAVDRSTPRRVRLLLAPSNTWKGHVAGQFIQLGVVIDGVRQTRCFSPSNAAAGSRGPLELTITARPGGLVSEYLHQHARVGTVVSLSPAAGEFTLPKQLPPSLVLISGGSGITPVLSMLRTALGSGHTGPITFVHYARSKRAVSHLDELQTLALRHPNLDLRLKFTRSDDDGHFDGAHLDGIARFDDAQIFMCGPNSLMDAVDLHHRTAGLTQPLHREAFTAPTFAAPDPSETTGGTVTFLRSGCSTDNDGRSLLEQAEGSGLTPQSGCRMGICFSCSSIKRSGTIRNLRTGEIDSESDTTIQLCINAPVGDVEIEV